MSKITVLIQVTVQEKYGQDSELTKEEIEIDREDYNNFDDLLEMVTQVRTALFAPFLVGADRVDSCTCRVNSCTRSVRRCIPSVSRHCSLVTTC